MDSGSEGMYVTFRKISLKLFYEHLALNGVNVNHYYIFMDRSQEAYHTNISLRKEIAERDPKAKITTKAVLTVQDLVAGIFEIQLKPQGVILPLSHSLFDVESGRYASPSQLMREIVSANKKHIEVSLPNNRTAEGAAFSIAHLHKPCRNNFKHKKIWLKDFLQSDGQNNILVDIPPVMNMNGKRINDLGLQNLAKDLSLIHCLGDTY